MQPCDKSASLFRDLAALEMRLRCPTTASAEAVIRTASCQTVLQHKARVAGGNNAAPGGYGQANGAGGYGQNVSGDGYGQQSAAGGGGYGQPGGGGSYQGAAAGGGGPGYGQNAGGGYGGQPGGGGYGGFGGGNNQTAPNFRCALSAASTAVSWSQGPCAGRDHAVDFAYLSSAHGLMPWPRPNPQNVRRHQAS